MRSLIKFAVLTCLWSVSGCDNARPNPLWSGEDMTATIVDEATGITPKFTAVEVSIRDKLGSCTTTFTPQPIMSGRKIEHGSTCGHPGTVTKLSWRYLGTTDEGDRYEFERALPVNESNATTIKKEVVYAGKEILLFGDEDSTVQMRPAASKEQSGEDSGEPTSTN